LEKAKLTANQLYLSDGDEVILYGAGMVGKTVLAKLRSVGIEPVAFADDTPQKQGKMIDGLQVMAPPEAASVFSRRAVFVVTILNPMLRFRDARRRLESLTSARVVSFLNVTLQYADVFLPYYQFESPQQLLGKAADIRRGFQLLTDEESRRQFVAHIRFRLHLDFDALPENSGDDYFPAEILRLLPDNFIFVDCGAYDGDTIRSLLRHRGQRFGQIIAFEPDETNYQKLGRYLGGLDPTLAGRIRTYNAGVGDRWAVMRFNSTGNMSAAFSGSGTREVEVVPLQGILEESGAAMYLKLDIEGAELEALKGAEGLLRRSRPLLAMSVYHRPDDLWNLPLYIQSLDLGHRFFLRTQGEDGMDLICYAIPPQ
jgi:FkbM family methyltransferase